MARGVLVTGLLGLAWVIAWWFSASPDSASQATISSTGAEPPSDVTSPEKPSLLTLLERMDVWGLALVRFIVDPVFYFYMFWIPKYLSQERGVSLKQIGELAWIPFLALGISNIAGGWVSDLLVRRGWPAFTARRAIMAVAALLTMASSVAGKAQSVQIALGMMALLMLAHGFWITNYVTLISERFPRSAVGTVMGFTGAVGAVGGIFANTGIGWMVDHYSYGPVWLISGAMYPLAFVMLCLTLRAPPAEIEPPRIPPPPK